MQKKGGVRKIKKAFCYVFTLVANIQNEPCRYTEMRSNVISFEMLDNNRYEKLCLASNLQER